MIESASNTSRRRRQVWLARMRQRDACWVWEVTLKGSRIVSKRSPCGCKLRDTLMINNCKYQFIGYRYIGNCVFWHLKKNCLFYDPRISSPPTFGGRFCRKFCDLYASIYGTCTFADRRIFMRCILRNIPHQIFCKLHLFEILHSIKYINPF